MADEAPVSAVGEREPALEDWLSDSCDLPVANGGKSVPFRVYWNGDDKFDVTFGHSGGALSSSVWVTVEGLETVISQCQRALDVSRGSQ